MQGKTRMVLFMNFQKTNVMNFQSVSMATSLNETYVSWVISQGQCCFLHHYDLAIVPFYSRCNFRFISTLESVKSLHSLPAFPTSLRNCVIYYLVLSTGECNSLSPSPYFFLQVCCVSPYVSAIKIAVTNYVLLQIWTFLTTFKNLTIGKLS